MSDNKNKNKNKPVKLRVKNKNSKPDGYTQCKNSQGDLLDNYYFKFTGGDSDDKGNLDFNGSGNVTVTIKSSLYIITDIQFTNNSKGDLSVVKNTPTCWTICDNDKHNSSGRYTVIVTNYNVCPLVAGIYCDPRWTNDVQ